MTLHVVPAKEADLAAYFKMAAVFLFPSISPGDRRRVVLGRVYNRVNRCTKNVLLLWSVSSLSRRYAFFLSFFTLVSLA